MNKYVVLYKNKKIVVYADTSYDAQVKGAQEFKAKNTYDCTVVLLEVEGKQVVHTFA